MKIRLRRNRCINCGKKHWTIIKYYRDHSVANVYCSKSCRVEYKRQIHMCLGFEDGYDYAYKKVVKEMLLNFKHQSYS